MVEPRKTLNMQEELGRSPVPLLVPFNLDFNNVTQHFEGCEACEIYLSHH